MRISRIGFGGMSLKSVSDEEAIRLLQQSISLGINFFDTADLYEHGRNEIIFGRALKDYRSEIFLATKVGNQWREDGSGWDWNPRKSYILKTADESLQRLGTEWIDLYQLHGGTINDSRDEVIDAFQQLQQAGKIRWYGISSIRPNVIRPYVAETRISSVMLQYSVADKRPEEEILDLLKKEHVGVLVRGALAQGLLCGKSPEEYLGLTTTQIGAAAEVVKNISGDTRTPAQTALRYVLHHPSVTSAVTGIRNEDQLIEAVTLFDTPDLSEPEYEQLKTAVAALKYEQHR